MQVYLDNAATTALDQRVLKKMLPFFSKNYGNASSIHNLGQEAFDVLQKAKKNVAYLLGGDENGVIFTSGATEANNFIIKGVALANRSKKKNKIIISAIEHPCVRESAKQLARAGFIVEILPVNKDGLVNPNNLRKIIDKRTILVSVMAVNNEVGTIQEIEKLAKLLISLEPIFTLTLLKPYPSSNLMSKKWALIF